MTHMRAELLGRLNAEAAAQGIDPVTEFWRRRPRVL
jgi:hypothetical protein